MSFHYADGNPIPQFNCQLGNCTNDSGYSIVCKSCRPLLTAYQKMKMTILWHELVVGESTTCFHCGEQFFRDQLCGDHFPYSKASAPHYRYDVRNGKPCCMQCNTSGSRHRKTPKLEDLEPFLPSS